MATASTWFVLATVSGLTYGETTEKSIASDPELHAVRFPNFSIITPDYYDNKSPPVSNGGPTTVRVRMDPWKIGRISVAQMTFEVDMYVVMYWTDQRLKFVGNENAPAWKRGIISESEAEKIWKPKLNFRNVMGSKGLSFEPGFMDMKLTEQTLFFVLRKVEKFHCHFDLSLYPMDIQSCAVEIEALTYKSSIRLQDVTTFHDFRGGSDPSEFIVFRHSSGPCTRKDGADRYYSCVEYRFYLRRQTAHHVMLIYIPSSLIVFLTWISFWLAEDATPARVGLGLTSLLTLATQFYSAQNNLPPVAYIKAIDIWMFACIFMVFASIVEFAIANYLARSSKSNVVDPVKQIETRQSCTKIGHFKHRVKMLQKGTSVDQFARVIFPSTFFIFVITYCSYYGST